MRSYNDILSETNAILKYMKVEPSGEAEEYVERGNVLCVYLASTTELLAEAKTLYNERKKDAAFAVINEFAAEKHLSAKVQNALVDGLLYKEAYLVDLVERCNAAVTHSLGWCRTCISKYKEELQITKAGNEFNNIRL
jgi:hypothetical protein